RYSRGPDIGVRDCYSGVHIRGWLRLLGTAETGHDSAGPPSITLAAGQGILRGLVDAGGGPAVAPSMLIGTGRECHAGIGERSHDLAIAHCIERRPALLQCHALGILLALIRPRTARHQ